MPDLAKSSNAISDASTALAGYRKIRDHQTLAALVALANDIERKAIDLVHDARDPLSAEHRRACLDTAGMLNREARRLRVRYGLPASELPKVTKS